MGIRCNYFILFLYLKGALLIFNYLQRLWTFWVVVARIFVLNKLNYIFHILVCHSNLEQSKVLTNIFNHIYIKCHLNWCITIFSDTYMEFCLIHIWFFRYVTFTGEHLAIFCPSTLYGRLTVQLYLFQPTIHLPFVSCIGPEPKCNQNFLKITIREAAISSYSHSLVLHSPFRKCNK